MKMIPWIAVFEKPPSSGVTKTPCLLVVTLVQSFLLLMLVISSTLLSIATSAYDGFKLPVMVTNCHEQMQRQ